MTDILVDGGKCTGMAAETKEGETLHIHADNTIMATGGIGGLYEHSTNFPILTGDACGDRKKNTVWNLNIWTMYRSTQHAFTVKSLEGVS